MTARDKEFRATQMLHGAFLITIPFFVLAVHFAAFPERPVSLSIVGALAIVAVGDIAFGLARRKQYMDKASRALELDADPGKALAAWRVANIFSFVHAETVALFGLALKFLGASWNIAGPFFFVSFALLLWWRPRMDWPVSSNAPSAPPPPAGTD